MSQTFLVTSEDMGIVEVCASVNGLQNGLEQSFTVSLSVVVSPTSG